MPRYEIDENTSAWLDAFRALAAQAVVAGHIKMLFFSGQIVEPESLPQRVARNLICAIGGFPHQAVIAFFIMSGYLVGGQALSRILDNSFDPEHYFIDRTARIGTVIVPALCLTAAVDWLSIHLGAGTSIVASPRFPNWWIETGPWRWATFFANLLMLQNIAAFSYGTNAALWSISSEYWYYVLFPALILVFRTKGVKRVAWGCAAAAVLAMFSLSANSHDPYRPAYFFAYAAIWCAGCAISFIRMRWRATIGACCLVVATASFLNDGSPVSFSGDVIVAVFAVGLILLSHLASATALGSAAKFCASYSFSLYATHFPVLICLMSFDTYLAGTVPHESASHSRFALYLLLLNGVALCFWFVTERNTGKVRNLLRRALNPVAATFR